MSIFGVEDAKWLKGCPCKEAGGIPAAGSVLDPEADVTIDARVPYIAAMLDEAGGAANGWLLPNDTCTCIINGAMYVKVHVTHVT